MKKNNIILTLAAVAVAMSGLSCTKSDKNDNLVQEKQTTILTADIPETKVSFQALEGGVFPLKWNNEGERVRAYCRANDAWVPSTTSTGCDVTNEGKTANFSIDLPETDAALRHLYIISPASSGYQILPANRPEDYLDIIRMDSKITPQIPEAASPDERYILMVSKHENLSEYPSTINLDLFLVESFGRMTVKGLNAASVSNIRITFPDRTYINGFLDYKISTDETILTQAGSSTNYIDIDPKNISINSTSFDVFFGIAPTTIAAGENIKFTFTTPTGDLVKEAVIPGGKTLPFSRGSVTGFDVDMTGVGATSTKVLTFDLSTNSAGLETNAWSGRGNKYITFTANDGNPYQFHRGGGCFFNTGTNTHTIYEDTSAGATNGFLGMPALPGYKLVSIDANRSNNTGANVKLEILDSCPKTETTVAMTGTITWAAGNPTPPTITLAGTAVNAMYYIHSLEKTWVPINGLTLTYESE